MLFRSEKCETRPAELILFGKKLSSIELFALTFRYLCEYEDRLRFGIVKSETGFPFASALTFHYLCGAEGYRLSFS